MSLIYLIIFVLCSIASLINIRKFILLYSPFKFIFHEGIYLKYTGFAISLDFAISLFAILVYFIRKSKYDKMENIFYYPLLFFSIIIIFHAIYPSISLATLFEEIIKYILFPVCVIKAMKSINHIVIYTNSVIIVSYIFIFNGLIDIIFGKNIIGDFMIANGGPNFYFSDNETARFGLMRTNSVFQHSICFGVSSALVLYYILFISLSNIDLCKILKKKALYLLIPFVIIGIVMSNSRTPLIAIFLGLLPFVNKNLFKGKKSIFIWIAIIMIIIVGKDYLIYMWNSIFNQDKVDAEGSTIEMRLGQLAIAIYYFMQSPIYGNGVHFDIFSNLSAEEAQFAFGMECVWFPILYRRGIIGIIGYCIFYLGLIYKTRHLTNCKYIKGYIFMWLISCTLTSLPGLGVTTFWILLIPIYKIITLTENLNNHGHCIYRRRIS